MSDYYQQESQFGLGSVTHAVQRVILITVGFFVAQLLLDIPFGDPYVDGVPGGELLTEYGAFSVQDAFKGYVWQPFSYMVLHANLSHVFFNMLWLFFFGPEVERVLGTRQFYRFYIFCGVAGVLANFIPYIGYQILFGKTINTLVVGASGSVLGVVMAFAMVNPSRQLFLFPLPFPIKAMWLVVFIVIMNVMLGVGGGSTTSVATHLGGLGAGFAYMKYRPMFNRRRWKKHSRRKAEGSSETVVDENVGKAIDNIFEFKGRDKK